MRKGVIVWIVLLLAAAASTALAGCASAHARLPYPGFDTPLATLQTFLGSAERLDYATTYSCYYQRYHERVSEQEFISHRRQAAVLKAYAIGPVSVSVDAAEATATLTFATSSGRGATTREVRVREDLVKQDGTWRIRVW